MPAKPSAAEGVEAAFLKGLLDGLDSSFFDAVPSPDPTPVKRKQSPKKKHVTPRRASPKKPVSDNVDMAMDLEALMQGVDDDWSDMLDDFMTPKKDKGKNKASVPTNQGYQRETCTRAIVEKIEDVYPQKILIVRLDPNRTDERRQVVLCHDWTSTDIRVDDVINILGTFVPLEHVPIASSSSNPPPTSTIKITSTSNLLVHHPDILLTPSALSSIAQCTRKPLISSLLNSRSNGSPALVWGNIMHEVMQSCLREGSWEQHWIDGKIEEGCRGAISELARIGWKSVDSAISEVKKRSAGLVGFGTRYVSQSVKMDAILTDTRSNTSAEPAKLAITKLHDVEEDIWCPTYGLKGKTDASVQALVVDPSKSTPFDARPSQSYPAPLELKTGRESALIHRAQTLLYTLLLSHRYGVEVPAGLLYYTQTEDVVRVPAVRNEIRGLIMGRNLLAGWMIRRGRAAKTAKDKKDVELPDFEEPWLPLPIDEERQCTNCFAIDACMLYRKTVENGPPPEAGTPLAALYDMKTGHLTPQQAAFFKQWEALISLEERDMVRFRKELWTLGDKEREGKGRAFAGIVLDESFLPEGDCSSRHPFQYRFVRSASIAPSLLNGHMGVGDSITISVDPDLIALARGTIISLTPSTATVAVDHKLSITDIRNRLDALHLAGSLEIRGPVEFRMDKEEMFSGMARIRDNLAHLFYVDGDARRLALVVDLAPPVFAPRLADEMRPVLPTRLNSSQTEAIQKILSAEEYALVLGMPGTGKTTLIAALITVLVGMGKTVLLTSYTHSAVDTILSKMLDAPFGILRLGNSDKVREDVRKFTLGTRMSATSVEQFEQQIMTPPVVATTCLSVDHPLFSRRTFDYCIVDEASQITLPTCLGPLKFAEKFVLVGDHFQLPPLVRNNDARKGGLDISLFRRLSTAHPEAVVDLTQQYRMNKDIMLISNKLVYSDRLQCGNDAVANQQLHLPDDTFIRTLHDGKADCGLACWIKRLMSPMCTAVFVDTDALPAPDSRVGDLVQNPMEAALVYQITETFIRSGISETSIGVLSPYRQQIKLLSHLLLKRKGIEILTADRSQGRDKECIIISMVRSNDEKSIGELVKDWRRMNVSFTRARSKLIVIGSRSTLKSASILADFFDLMEAKDWVLELPPNADTLHTFSSGGALATPGKRPAEDMSDFVGEAVKENIAEERPAKKARTPQKIDKAIFKGRPILRDVFNGDM